MRDPMDSLRKLSDDVSATPLPVREVRRRGDRMRRRRGLAQVVAAAAVVAAVVSGGAFASGKLTGAEDPVGPVAPAPPSPPSPRPSTAAEPAPEGGWLTTPPQGFPLDALLPSAPRESGEAMLFVCSEATVLPALDTAVHDEGLWVPGPRQQDRQLYLFSSGSEARAAYETVLEAWRDCAPSPLEAGAEFRFEVTAVRPDRFWVFREAYDARGEAAPEAGPAAIYEVRLYGNALFGASIWDPSGESPLLTTAGRDFERALEQIDAASCVFLREGCGDDVEDPAPFAQVDIARGLPEPGGDVPEWTRSEGAPLSAAACGGREDLPASPVADYRVEVSPPDENAWRHLLVFEDERAAVALIDQLRSSAVVCNETIGTSADDPTDPAEMRWAVSDLPGSPALLAIDGLAFADGTENRVPGRVLTRAVRVGRAVLVAQVSDASTRLGTDEVAVDLTDDVRGIVSEMCYLAEGSCETG